MKTSETFEVTLNGGLAKRLRALAERSGHDINDCLVEAITEYVMAREDFAAAMAHLEEAEERVFLRVVGE